MKETSKKLNPAEKLTLMRIRDLDGSRATYMELAEYAGTGRTTMYSTLKNLKERGLIVTSEGRKNQIRMITKLGLSLL